ncbi:MAG: pullulanase [Rhodothermales bacterium]|nr:pullulanase [Rhodothermales bacterium]
MMATLPMIASAQDDAPRLRAEIHGPRAITVEWVGTDRPAAGSLQLTDGQGQEIGIESVIPNTASKSLLVPATPIDPMRVYFVIDREHDLRERARRDPWFRTLYSSKPLGASVTEDRRETAFRLFAPRATSVVLYLYLGPDDEEPAKAVPMVRDQDGVWEVVERGDHHGVYYDFTIHGPPDPGNWFYETHPQHVSDPYALVSMDSYGRSRVWVDGPPPPPVVGGRPAMESVVAYEVHVQDFTDLLPVAEGEVGKLPAMHQAGLTNGNGDPIGIDYLEDLGVNVVHLMPVQEYLHYPDEDWQADMADDAFARDMAIDRENYQWGYRTTHAFAVESRFRSEGLEPGSERQEFKDLVAAFHERGMAVIIDVVPNHTGENMDGRHLLFNFNAIDLPYYYRTDADVNHIGPFGNEVKTEDRPMVQRWIVDQLRHWVEELGVDGFRIDLAGQIDQQTLIRVMDEMPDDIIIYGEPWIAPSDPDVRANPDWSWYKADSPITFFQDDARNAFKGSPFSLEDRGYAGGDASARDRVMAAIANAYDEEPSPNNGISYLDIHDNWALADRYALEDYNGREGVDVTSMRLAAGLLLTSLGPVVLHGGTEMMRSKGLAPMEEFERHIAGGTIYFKGRGDTYNVRAPNRFEWERLDEPAIRDMRDHWRGLIALRLGDAGQVFRIADPAGDHIQWVTPEDPALLGYVLGGQVAVAVNVGAEDGTVSMRLPEGSWTLVSNGISVDHVNGVSGAYPMLEGGGQDVTVPARTMFIWVKR